MKTHTHTHTQKPITAKRDERWVATAATAAWGLSQRSGVERDEKERRCDRSNGR